MVTWTDGGDPVISGSEALTTPSGSQFTVTGGNGPYTWSVSGTGASIDQDGYLTLGGACGSYEITCTDCTGRSATLSGRVTNNGVWSQTVSCDCHCTFTPTACAPHDYYIEITYVGIYKYLKQYHQHHAYGSLICPCVPNCSPDAGCGGINCGTETLHVSDGSGGMWCRYLELEGIYVWACS